MNFPGLLLDKVNGSFVRVLLLAGIFCSTAAASEWRVLDRVVLQKEEAFAGQEIGGLSGVAYNPDKKELWAVSDGRQGPKSLVFRFELGVDVQTGKMSLEPKGVLALQSPGDRDDPLDAEGIALWTRNRLFISHEGSKLGGLAPGIACFSSKTGNPLFGIPIPTAFLPSADQPMKGVQKNRGFESVCLSRPRAHSLFTASEAPLIQDLANPKDAASGPVRILRYRVSALKEAPEQKAYEPDRDALFGSVVDMLAVPGSTKLWVLERQLLWPVMPRQRRIRIYEVDFAQPDATDVSALDSLRGASFAPLAKRLVFDSGRDGLRDPENMEGMTWGPEVQAGPTILLVGDDNFSKSQRTEFVLIGK